VTEVYLVRAERLFRLRWGVKGEWGGYMLLTGNEYVDSVMYCGRYQLN
jgi:hypothetical protein